MSDLIKKHAHPRCDWWFQDFLAANDGKIAEFFGATCNSIWYARKSKLFENRSIDAHSLVVSVGNMLQDYHNSRGLTSLASASLSSCHLLTPPAASVRIFFDGATSKLKNCCGVGVWTANSDGSFIFARARCYPGHSDSELAEFLALREALSLISELGVPQAHILGDSAVAILAALGEAEYAAICFPVLAEIQYKLAAIPSRNLFWVRRPDNSIAHLLAAFAKSNVKDVMSWSSPPRILYQSGLADLQQV